MTTKADNLYVEHDGQRVAIEDYIRDMLEGLVVQFRSYDPKPQAPEIFHDLEMLTAKIFREETAPDGTKWPDLAARTIKAKGHDVKLFETGRLRDSVVGKTEQSIQEATGDMKAGVDLIFGTEGRAGKKATPKVGRWHMEGTKRMPARPFLGWTAEAIKVLQYRVLTSLQATLAQVFRRK